MTARDLPQLLAIVHPDFEATIPADVSAEPDIYRGHEGIRRYLRSFEADMEEIRFVPEQFWEAGERVVVSVMLSAKGRSTGIPVAQRTGQVWTFSEGMLRSARVYPDPAGALQAVGLA